MPIILPCQKSDGQAVLKDLAEGRNPVLAFIEHPGGALLPLPGAQGRLLDRWRQMVLVRHRLMAPVRQGQMALKRQAHNQPLMSGQLLLLGDYSKWIPRNERSEEKVHL